MITRAWFPGTTTYLQEVHEFAVYVQLLDATVEAGSVPEVPVVEGVRPDLGWNASDEHGAAALLQNWAMDRSDS